uniref:Uncharacterized protein n=1 Tax=Chenopodium quinoa TaxID=63459 RepID=A0A803LNK7_CHEQI
MGDKRATPTAVKQLSRWIRSRSVRQLVTMASIAAFIFLVLLKVFVKNYTYFYVAAQLAHSIGLSLKTQELTAVFLTMRIACHFMLVRDIYVVLDCLTLVSTLWVIYMIRYKLKQTYLEELDNMPLYYVLVPSAVVALIGHPGFGVNFSFRFFYMYSKTIEAVSVLPQLRLIQNAKMVEPFTAHYVFALGVARFFTCANWLIMCNGGTEHYETTLNGMSCSNLCYRKAATINSLHEDDRVSAQRGE